MLETIFIFSDNGFDDSVGKEYATDFNKARIQQSWI